METVTFSFISAPYVRQDVVASVLEVFENDDCTAGPMLVQDKSSKELFIVDADNVGSAFRESDKGFFDVVREFFPSFSQKEKETGKEVVSFEITSGRTHTIFAEVVASAVVGAEGVFLVRALNGLSGDLFILDGGDPSYEGVDGFWESVEEVFPEYLEE